MNVLVVGHGLVGKRRASAISELAAHHEVTLAGTVDPVARDPAGYGGAPHYQALSDVPPGSYDAAVVALPHDLAPSVAEQVVTSGRPVLLEKPLGRSVTEAEQLVAASCRCTLPCFVGYNYRFLPHVSELLARVLRQELGPLRSIDMLLGHGGHPG